MNKKEKNTYDKYFQQKWNGWKGCCRHCNRGISVCGPLNEYGFCIYCMKKGYDSLYKNK